ncbi:MAG: hypothetical protein IJD93_04065 [Ruminococcus sp.]|nr:hypothetical protein [Ruminococcus sp.]
MNNLLHINAREGLCNCRIKLYPDEGGAWVPVEMMISERKIFNPSGLESEGWKSFEKYDDNSRVETDIKSSQSTSDRAVKRARAKVLDIIRCNTDFKYFCTLTYNGESFARDDYKSVVASFSMWCDNRVRRKGLKYLAVIERHKDKKGLHFHVLCNDVLKLVDSGTVKVPDRKKPIKVTTADRYKVPEADRKTVYNISDWCYGFSTAIEITGDAGLVKVSAYLQKYLTKESEKVGGRWYYSGGVLLRPVYRYCDNDYYSADYDYQIDIPGNSLRVLRFENGSHEFLGKTLS